MSTLEARIVKAHIDDKGTVEDIDDPFYEHFWDPSTRLDRALEEEHYGWKPHEKSMTMGHLAGHLAEMPGWGASIFRRKIWNDLECPPTI